MLFCYVRCFFSKSIKVMIVDVNRVCDYLYNVSADWWATWIASCSISMFIIMFYIVHCVIFVYGGTILIDVVGCLPLKFLIMVNYISCVNWRHMAFCSQSILDLWPWCCDLEVEQFARVNSHLVLMPTFWNWIFNQTHYLIRLCNITSLSIFAMPLVCFSMYMFSF